MKPIYLHHQTSTSYMTLIYDPAAQGLLNKQHATCLSSNNSGQHEQLHLTDFILDNSRRLLVWCLMRPAVRGVCPMPGLACSRCVSQLHVLVMADLPALRLRN